MNKRAWHNLTQTERTITIRGYIPWSPDGSLQIWKRCRQQAAAHNRAVAELLERPKTPLRKSAKRGATGLQGLWIHWRNADAKLADILQAIWRPGVALAKTRIDAWEAANEAQAEAVVAGLEETNETNKTDDKTDNRKKRVPSRRKIRPDFLFCRRKRRDRRRANRLIIEERIGVIDTRTLRVPGVGDIRLRKPLPEGFEARSATFIERTPRSRGKNIAPEERSWKVHLTTRIPAPLKDLPPTPESAGMEHGVVHPETTSSSDGTSEHLHYDTPEPTRERRYKRIDKRKKGCRRQGHWSRRRRKLQRQQTCMRQRALRQRAHQRRIWANRIAISNDLVGIENLQNANMRRSARGDNEQPGRSVAAKSGLNRCLAESSPGYQTAEQMAACVRHGTRYRLVPAAGTSITCGQCGHRDRRNRETQAVFRCRQCQHKANADVNAAEVVRLLAEAYTRIGVNRSWATKRVAERAEAALRKAARARGATAAQRSTVPETRTPKPAESG